MMLENRQSRRKFSNREKVERNRILKKKMHNVELYNIYSSFIVRVSK
jgi:hypothetical protein